MKKGKYCLTANIKSTRKGLWAILKLDAWTFPCGKPVYICNDLVRESASVLVMGLGRLKTKYFFDYVSIESLEDIQCNFVYDSRVIELMDSPELRHLWWGDKPETWGKAERHAEMLRRLQRKSLEL